MKKILNETEKERIKLLYESKGLLYEMWGTLAKKALGWVGKNEDDIANIFKTTEVALAKQMEDIVNAAIKAKNISACDDMQAKLMHFFNPSGLPEKVAEASAKTINVLNGFAKSRNYANWGEVRKRVSYAATPKDWFTGKRISNRLFVQGQWLNGVDFSKISGSKNMDDYNKIIARAIDALQKGDDSMLQYVSRGGFESFGIPNFRDYLRSNISKINEVVPETGRWSVIFK
jgi:hypothetical protein